MNKINILDEATINKIAAGEVIERPASVVKELIENSIDAGATDIRVEVAGNGLRSIRVTDNGCGMSREDVLISFLKHATSKIKDAYDIENVRTLGFRGEALSSIAAVSKLEIITRQEDELAGTKITVHGGEVVTTGEVGTPRGTSMLVEDLFYNIPARKKFLKTGRTELAHIVDVVTRVALGQNHISFILINDGLELFRSPASGNLFDTIVHIYGPDIARALLPVDFKSDLAVITGYISKPGTTRNDRNFMVFFVNERQVNSKAVNEGLRLGYYTMLQKGRYPIAVLKISLDTKEVDVNVHPSKQQIRFGRELLIIDNIHQAISLALKKYELIPEQGTFTQSHLYATAPEEIHTIREVQAGFKVPVTDSDRRLKHTERYIAQAAEKRRSYPDIQILGQVDDVYIVAKTNDGIVIIDQHAAHERVLYEQVQRSEGSSQELITPVNLELDPKEKVLIMDYIPHLESLGFSISEFGPGSFAVTAVPVILGKLEDAALVHDIITDILSWGRIKDDTGLFERVCRSMACRGAIKAGATLTFEQMEGLVDQLYQSGNPHTCPHGRPTVVPISRESLDKMFQRI